MGFLGFGWGSLLCRRTARVLALLRRFWFLGFVTCCRFGGLFDRIVGAFRFLDVCPFLVVVLILILLPQKALGLLPSALLLRYCSGFWHRTRLHLCRPRLRLGIRFGHLGQAALLLFLRLLSLPNVHILRFILSYWLGGLFVSLFPSGLLFCLHGFLLFGHRTGLNFLWLVRFRRLQHGLWRYLNFWRALLFRLRVFLRCVRF